MIAEIDYIEFLCVIYLCIPEFVVALAWLNVLLSVLIHASYKMVHMAHAIAAGIHAVAQLSLNDVKLTETVTLFSLQIGQQPIEAFNVCGFWKLDTSFIEKVCSGSKDSEQMILTIPVILDIALVRRRLL